MLKLFQTMIYEGKNLKVFYSMFKLVVESVVIFLSCVWFKKLVLLSTFFKHFIKLAKLSLKLKLYMNTLKLNI